MLAPGTPLAGYTIDRLLGQGGMGVVYEATQESLARRVALKVLSPALADQPGFHERFRREGLIQARLGHPHVVPVYEAGTSEHGHFIAMQFIEGGDLRSLVRGERTDTAAVIALLGQVADALDAAHAAGLLHRDVKPHNILVDNAGHAYLADFGLGRGGDQLSLTATGDFVGTVHYAAPEQVRGERPTPAGDIYSFGVVLHEALTGSLPFSGPAAAVLFAHVESPPPRVTDMRPDLAPAIDEVLSRALAKDPESRYASARELVAAARAALAPAGGATRLRPPVAVPPAALPAFLRDARRDGFVAREAELEALERFAETTAADGTRRLCVVSGDAGLGKTRLVAEFCQQASTRGTVILGGRVQEEALVPYQPFREAVDEWVARASHAALAALPAASQAELSRAVPRLRERMPDLPEPLTGDPDGDRYRLFQGFTSLLAGLSAPSGPVVLVLDDLQWADPGTVLLLRHLLRAPELRGLAVIATFRDGETSGDPGVESLFTDLHRDGVLERFPLRGLREEAIGKLVSALAGKKQPSALARQVARATDGNPFFAVELARHLSENAGSESVVPEGVKGVVGRRLARLGDGVREVLEWAAVLGRDFDADALAALTGSHDDELVDYMDHACATRLVEEIRGQPGAYRFSHALVRETVRERLSGARRARMHAVVFAWMTEDASSQSALGLVAYHAHEAQRLVDPARALEFAESAGAAALDALAFEDAATQFERALAACDRLPNPDPARRLSLLLRVADAQLKAARTDESFETFLVACEAARDAGDALALGEAALGLGWSLNWGRMASIEDGRQPAMARTLEEAIEAQAPGDSELKARLLASLAIQNYFADSRARKMELSIAASEMARRLGSPYTTAYALNSLHYSAWGPDSSPRERLEIANEMLEAAQAAGNLELTLMAHVWRVVDFIEMGDRDAAEREAQVQRTLAERMRQPRHEHLAAMRQAAFAILDGRFAEAERIAESVTTDQRAVDTSDLFMAFAVQVFAIRLQQGRVDEMIEPVSAFVEQYPALPAWRAAKASALAEAGHVGEAAAEVERLASDGFAFPRDSTFPVAVAKTTEAAIAVGALHHLPTLKTLLAPLADRMLMVGHNSVCDGPVALKLAQIAEALGDLDEAQVWFESALAGAMSLRSAPLVAETQVRYGAMLMRRGDDESRRRGVALVRAGAEEASEHGFVRIARIAAAVTGAVDSESFMNATTVRRPAPAG